MSRSVVIVPDSFKGTLSAVEVCGIITRAIRDRCGDVVITEIPMADGGEGTCEAFRHALGGEMVSVQVCDPFLERKDAFYWKKDRTAVVEMAAAAGFIEDATRRDPAVTSTFGVGELIGHAIDAGCDRIVLGLGGSCTNDAGLGMAAALGAVFRDGDGREFIPVGSTLEQICAMDLIRLKERIRNVRIEVMCDVSNPLYGENGAAYVFAPQKGADEEKVRMLDRNLRAFADLIQRTLGVDVSDVAGGGAAGGAGAGAYVLLGAELKPGAQIVLEMNRFRQIAQSADLIITGEGQLDDQSLQGKVVVTVADQAKAAHVPVIAVVGNTKGDITPVYGHGVKQVIRSIDQCRDPEHYQDTCREDLYSAVLAMRFSGRREDL